MSNINLGQTRKERDDLSGYGPCSPCGSSGSDDPEKKKEYENKVIYPSLYIDPHPAGELELEDDQMVNVKCRVTSVIKKSKDGKTTQSFELEAQEITPLDEKPTTTTTKNSSTKDDEDAIDQGLDEAEEKD